MSLHKSNMSTLSKQQNSGTMTDLLKEKTLTGDEMLVYLTIDQVTYCIYAIREERRVCQELIN